MPFVLRNGLRIHYADVGEGLPVLLLHAFPLSSEAFRPQIEALSKQFRFIVPDHRGFGQSEVGDSPTQMETLAEDALAILDDAKVPSAIVGGVSMGGYASMALLRRSPGRVKALVLADTQALPDDDTGKVRRETLAREVLDKGMTVLVDQLLPKLLSPNAPAGVKSDTKRIILENPPQGAAAASRGMGLRLDSRDILARYAGPSLVVIGERDAITPLARADELAQLLRGARLVQVPGVGHLSNQEAPDAFNRELEAFLATCR